jgi:hypothetical protein
MARPARIERAAPTAEKAPGTPYGITAESETFDITPVSSSTPSLSPHGRWRATRIFVLRHQPAVTGQ